MPGKFKLIENHVLSLYQLKVQDFSVDILKMLKLFQPNPSCNKTAIAEFANSEDPYEMSHNELSHLDLQGLPSSL